MLVPRQRRAPDRLASKAIFTWPRSTEHLLQSQGEREGERERERETERDRERGPGIKRDQNDGVLELDEGDQEHVLALQKKSQVYE